MTGDELERSLLAHYRAIDPGHAPHGLRIRIGDALESRPRRRVVTARARPALAAALAVVLIVVVGLGLRVFQSSAGASPTPTASRQPGSPSPSASSSASPSPTPTPTPALPSGSVPPVSSAAWTRVRLQPLTDGPVGVSAVGAWSGGYVALGQGDERSPLPAWISRDGRSWVSLPDGTFGSPVSAFAAPCPDGVVVATQSYSGDTMVWHSTDGVTWTSSAAAPMRLNQPSDLAGNATGVVAILAEAPYGLVFSPDGVAWESVVLPGGPAASVQAVAAFGSGFVAVGESGSGATGDLQPLAWWSPDGRTWTLASVQSRRGDGFIAVSAASAGLVAESHDAGVPGTTRFWTSSDGRSWKVSSADPLGTVTVGVGSGANGLFVGDGARILGYGIRAENQPTQYWVSLDGSHWTRLALAGDTAAAQAGEVMPFLLRDGVLFSSADGSWFGASEK
jgi:hypothetical protein